MMTQFRKFRKSLVKTRRSSRIVENLEKSLRPIADRFHAYTGSDMHLLVNFYMAYNFYLNFFLALSFCPFLQVLFPAVSCALSLALLQGFYIFWPFYSDFKRSSFFPFFRDAKSSRGCRYICAIFSAGANFWAILGHFWAILAKGVLRSILAIL